MKHLFFISILFLLLNTACEKAFLGATFENNPVNNFEIFWKDINKHSGIIFSKKINWDSVYQVYQPKVTPNTSDEELWGILTQMIEAFDDEHTFVEDVLNDKTYVSGSHRIEAAIEGFSKELIEEKYLEYRTEIMTAPDWSYGKIKEKNIGYIYLGDVDGWQAERTMDSILEVIGQHKAIIFDVRNNGGGSADFASAIVRPFAEQTQQLFSEQERNGPNHNDFGAKIWEGNVNDGENQYLRPLVVLTDRFTISGAERIAYYLRANSQSTHIGDTTAGAFSETGQRRFLLNGWQYQYPIKMTLDLDGNSLDNEGLIPDFTFKNTKADIEAQQDRMLERAFEFLFERYGIQ